MKMLLDINLTEQDKKTYWKTVKKGKEKNACWEWLGKFNDYGQGCFVWIEKDENGKSIVRNIYAQRIAWFLEYGQMHKDLFIKASCKKRDCVNPNHLIAVSPSEFSALKKQGVLPR